MKIILILCISLLYHLGYGQTNFVEFYIGEYTQCYVSEYAEVKDSVLVFNSPNESLDTVLQIRKDLLCGYIFSFSDSKNGCYLVEDVSTGPSCNPSDNHLEFHKLRGKWIKSDKLVVDLTNYTNERIINVYTKSDTNSKIVFKSNKFHTAQLLASDKSWAKVKFEESGNTIIGWIAQGDYCAYHWTACNR